MKDLETNRDKNLKTKKLRSDDIALEGKEKVVIPIVQESLRVGKREVERGGVRVESHLIEQPVEESIELREENVRVERLVTDRPVTDEDLRAMRDNSVEMIEHAEVAMLSKEARVVEEVIISKAATKHNETFQDTVRHNEVSVQQLDGKLHTGTPAFSSRPLFSTFENDFRSHFTAGNYAGYKYDDFAPVYQYGYDIALSDRYRDKDWAFIESDAGLDWEKRNPGTWEKVKDAAKHAWQRTLGRLATPPFVLVPAGPSSSLA